MKLTHPKSSHTIECDEADAEVYESQGWQTASSTGQQRPARPAKRGPKPKNKP